MGGNGSVSIMGRRGFCDVVSGWCDEFRTKMEGEMDGWWRKGLAELRGGRCGRKIKGIKQGLCKDKGGVLKGIW